MRDYDKSSDNSSSARQGLISDDDILWEGRPIPIYYLWIIKGSPVKAVFFIPMLFYTGFKIYKLFWGGGLETYELGLVFLFIPIIIIAFFLMDYFNYLAQQKTSYQLTKKELIINTGFLKMKTFSFDLSKINKPIVVQNPKKDYGNIHFYYKDKIKYRTYSFSRHGVSPTFSLEQIENPKDVLRMMLKRRK